MCPRTVTIRWKIWKFMQMGCKRCPYFIAISIVQDHQQGINFYTDFPVQRHKVCIISYNTNPPRLAQLRSGRSVASRILRNSKLSIQTINYMFLCKGVQLKPKAHQNETWSAAAWPPCRLSYRSSVFFRHLRFTALSFPQAKTRRWFKKCYYFKFYFA